MKDELDLRCICCILKTLSFRKLLINADTTLWTSDNERLHLSSSSPEALSVFMFLRPGEAPLHNLHNPPRMHQTAFLPSVPVSIRTPHPSTSPRRSHQPRQSTPSMNTPHDLLIIGAGHLGQRIAGTWREKHPVAEILGETRTDASHATLSALGITPVLAGTTTRPFPYVVFCAPPSKFPDYPHAVQEATERVLPDGRFVFTSSTSVYGDVPFANEHTARKDTGRAEKLFHAENAVMGIPGGVVVRLSGLYVLERGAHTFWISRGEVPGSEESILNLIHYSDAADAVVKALLVDKLSERVFLAAADKSITRRDLIEAALRHPKFEKEQRPRFMNDSPATSRRFDNSWSRAMLGWSPKYETFAEFIDHEIEERKTEQHSVER